ncbi:sensor histidine kinase [Nocardioides sp. KR10-350]|uniref:sensor histidine kinase n=1 Tax=Nocardioides cheoyonin TaxID=3156615 RepID=UPI0032B4FD0C
MAEPSYTRTADRKTRSAWRGIRPRLIGILLVPTIAALGFGALRMQAAVSESSDAARAESIADALPDSFRLAIQLTVERDAGSSDIPAETLAKIQGATDKSIRSWQAKLPQVDFSDDAGLRHDLIVADDTLDKIDALRKQLADPATRTKAQRQYTVTLNDLFDLAGHLPALSDGDVFTESEALGEIRTASEALGDERELMTKALAAGHISIADLAALARAESTWTAVSTNYYEHTSPAARAAFDKVTDRTTEYGSGGVPAQGAVDKLLRTGDVSSLGVTLPQWQKAYSDFVTKMQDVIVRSATDIADDVSASREDAQRSAIINAVVIFLVLFAALGAAMLAARSILRPLARLRLAALGIAHRELPGRVRELERADGPVDVLVEPLGIGGRDEIGEVAEAFDAVHAEAVRLAGEQAQIRANVNKMFVNLSRRSTSLVERQLRLIDQLEANEQDPEDLANLFRLDHLATRMRRNDESLLVLAGGDNGPTARGDVPVLDVLRAAASEIEQFARVEIDSAETAEFRGQVAGDLVHLLAELIENATNFSPPDTPVVVGTGRTQPGNQLLIEIRDQGIGMTPEELAAANTKLRRTTGLDADVARMMGLVVTSRLAARHGLAVDLVANNPRGVVARVVVPDTAFAGRAEDPRSVLPWAQERPQVPTEASFQGTGHEQSRPFEQASQQALQQPSRPPQPPQPPSGLPVRTPGSAPGIAPDATPWSTPTVTPATGPTPAYGVAPAATTGENWFAGTSAATGRPEARPVTPQRRDPIVDLLGPSALDLPAEVQDDDVSPIFESLESEWFRRRPLNARRPHPGAPTSRRTGSVAADDTAENGLGGRDRRGWASPGDEGWRRAAELERQQERRPAAVTAGGLPVRVPGQNLIPGAAPATEHAPAQPQRGLDPRRTRGLSSFQQGVSRARSTTDQADRHPRNDSLNDPLTDPLNDPLNDEEQQ